MSIEKQSELFGEFKNQEERGSLLNKGAFPEKSFTFILSRDKLILVSVGLIILLIIVFALGFEKGKGRTALSSRPAAAPAQRQVYAPAPVPLQEAKKPAAQQPQALKPYTIQVATFKSKDLAQQETAKLKKLGFPAVILEGNGLYEVRVGEFADTKAATSALNTLKRVYKDCYIRKR
ncbi:MAG: SPOR domain-containing protein [Candidatus Omnitrophica bacterium]|nr:SPOR domain-containing protein [Candidatus Omnitrophota bacterium]